MRSISLPPTGREELRIEVAMKWPGPAPARDYRADPLLTLLILVAAVLPPLFVIHGRDGDRGPVVTVFWISLTAIHAGFFVLTRRVAAGYDGSRRRLWWLLASAGLIWAVGDARQVLLAITDPANVATVEGTVFQEVTLLLGMMVVLAGLLRRRSGNRAGLRLDVATVTAGAVTAGVLLVQLPDGAVGPRWIGSLVVTVLISPGVFLVVVFALVRLFLAGTSPFTRAAGLIYALAATLQAVLQAIPTHNYSDPSRGAWLIAGNTLGSALLLVAARVQTLTAPAGPTGRASRPYSWLPYGAMLLTWSVGVGALALQGLTWRAWLVIAGAMVTTALVVARQTVAFRHIAVLLGERDALTARLTEQAFHDALTGLANRALFLRRLASSLARGPVTVLLVDLDEFKPVNDRFGHATGDRLLVEVGRRLRACVRTGDTVARLGGDEFAVLVGALDEPDRAALTAALAEQLTDTVELDGVTVRLRASIGSATGAGDPDSLLHAADMAMYENKNAGRALRR